MGKNEDMQLEPGRELIKIDDETRLNYQTPAKSKVHGTTNC